MVSAITPLRHAQALLDTYDGDLPPRPSLALAFHLVWQAASRPGWPPEARARAEELCELFLSRGPIDWTAERMTDDEARQAVHHVRELATRVATPDSFTVPDEVRRRAVAYVAPLRLRR